MPTIKKVSENSGQVHSGLQMLEEITSAMTEMTRNQWLRRVDLIVSILSCIVANVP
jgi:hypothetical protein